MKHKSQENAVFIAIHPPTYRSGGFLAHGVLNLCITIICITITYITMYNKIDKTQKL